MGRLRYKIEIKGVVIATFFNEYDRNVSLNALAEEFDKPMCGPMPEFCNHWPCSGDENSRLEPDENGFMCCIKCGGSYGRVDK